MTFNAERKAFAFLRENCSDAAKAEYVRAVGLVIERYNTSIYENRFVAGCVIEVFTYALMRSAGLSCNLYADQEKGGDIMLPNHKHLSVKGSFTGGVADVKLLNQMGDGDRPWEVATLFVVSEIGIVYGDPDLVDPGWVKQVGDGVKLDKAALKHLMKDPKNVIELEIPKKPSKEMAGKSLKASESIALKILNDENLTHLLDATRARDA